MSFYRIEHLGLGLQPRTMKIKCLNRGNGSGIIAF